MLVALGTVHKQIYIYLDVQGLIQNFINFTY